MRGKPSAAGQNPRGGLPPAYCNAMTNKRLQSAKCPFIYINGHAYKGRAKMQNLCLFTSFCFPTLTPISAPQIQHSSPQFHPIREQKQMISRAVLIIPHAFPCIHQPIRPRLRYPALPDISPVQIKNTCPNFFHTAKLLPIYADSVFKFLKRAFAGMFFRV